MGCGQHNRFFHFKFYFLDIYYLKFHDFYLKKYISLIYYYCKPTRLSWTCTLYWLMIIWIKIWTSVVFQKNINFLKFLKLYLKFFLCNLLFYFACFTTLSLSISLLQVPNSTSTSAEHIFPIRWEDTNIHVSLLPEVYEEDILISSLLI